MITRSKPVETIRDGRIKATIWRNQGEKGAFFPVTFSRTYKDGEGNLQDGDSFTKTELLKVLRLADRAYDTVLGLEAAEKQEA
ncbi:MAG: hypothetical protein AAGA75_17320 [Cyanobacteria bacterium P01_E01_bin.6]